MRRRTLAIALSCALAASLAGGTAVAKEVTTYVYSGSSFNGSDSTAGPFSRVHQIAIDEATNDVYVLDAGSGGVIDRFDAEGNSTPFSSSGSTSIVLGEWDSAADIAVDNSGTATQGNIYVRTPPMPNAGVSPMIRGLDSSGDTLPGGNWPLCGQSCGKLNDFMTPFGMTTDADGAIWVTHTAPPTTFFGSTYKIKPFTASGEVKEPGFLLGSNLEPVMYTAEGNSCCVKGSTMLKPFGRIAIDSTGAMYLIGEPRIDYPGTHGLAKYSRTGTVLNPAVSPQTMPEIDNTIVPDSGLAIDRSTDNLFVSFGDRVDVFNPDGEQIASFGSGALDKATGVAVNAKTGDVYVANRQGGNDRVEIYEGGATVTVPDVETGPVTGPRTFEKVTLTGTVDPDGGGDTTECYFEYGVETELDKVAPCKEGHVHPSEGGPVEVTADVSGLSPCQFFALGMCFDDFLGFPRQKGIKYSYRLVAKNAEGPAQGGKIRFFRNADSPVVDTPTISEVTTGGATVAFNVDPRGGDTTYRFEYGTSTAYGSVIEKELEFPWHPDKKRPAAAQDITLVLEALEPDQTYHYRVIVENPVGADQTADRVFRTFAKPTFEGSCPNALARQQTGAAKLLDCRAYELASAADQGGYDVVSDLAPGQNPLPAFPRADGKILYSVHDGGIPGSGDPTNRGPDPYVATRGADGWSTRYVGIPSAGIPSTGPFSSTFADADSGLSTFAFAGPEICNPCFADGSTGIPLRLPDGTLVQGMAGSLDPGPGAEPAGHVAKHLSADGSHFLFGSASRFEPDGNNNGDVSIYKRDLVAGTTQVVSKTPAGETMTGEGIAALDISADGSRTLIGKRVSTDAAGNDYWDLYMHVGNATQTIEVLDSASGALYNGMTSDGSKVFFTTPDALSEDTDTSADLYRADVSSSAATLSRLSTGAGAGDTDACNPASNSDGPDWNVVSGGASCGTVAIGGGGGMASGSGAIYFLSPEDLDGNGAANQPNLYLSTGADPIHVATLDPDDALVRNAVADSATHHTADFQVNPSGASAFTTVAPLSGYESRGHTQVFGYAPGEGAVGCRSCPITEAPATGDAALASNGLSITDDGRVFFNSPDRVVLGDSNGRLDAYEWTPADGGRVALISTGTSDSDSSLLSVTADGTDAFFFTRSKRDRADLNGPVLKIYTAREGGGFFDVPPPQPCKAADECRGPGTQAAPPAPIQTIAGTDGRARRQQTRNCGRQARKARRLSRRAKALRRKAKRSSGKQAKRLRGRAARSARKARRASRVATRCRARARGENR